MNLLDAVEILELPQNFSPLELKQNYKRLAMKYHPDKNNGNSEQFIQIQNAYEFLNKEPDSSFGDIQNLFKKVVQGFVINVPAFKKTNKQIKVAITIKEYFTGTTKKIKSKKNCNCKASLCISCAGSGYNILKKPMDVCMECLGDGYIKNCDCFEFIEINLPKCPKEDQIIISEDNYFFHSGKLCYNFKISLKDSLLGFKKTFKDPFDNEHLILVNQIIKTGDGYTINVNGNNLILVFDVEYPKKLSVKVKKVLNTLDF
jgi:DnaJ-class molecular chaperone